MKKIDRILKGTALMSYIPSDDNPMIGVMQLPPWYLEVGADIQETLEDGIKNKIWWRPAVPWQYYRRFYSAFPE
jgi:hypothetical protein